MNTNNIINQSTPEYDAVEEETLKNLIKYEAEGQNWTTITDIPFLEENASSVQKIKLNQNKLSSISEFFKFSNLIYLELTHNNLTKLESMTAWTNWEILILSNNNLKSLNFCLVPLSKLQHWDIGFNLIEITDSVIKSLKYNTCLISLVWSGNIGYDFEMCKYICLESLTSVEFLDTVRIIDNTKKEINVKSACVKVKGVDGRNKKVRTVKDYIKFKRADIEENQDKYENIRKDKETKNQLLETQMGSYYFMQLLNSYK